MQRDWPQLEHEARSVVDQVISELPFEIRIEAEQIPCLLEPFDPEDPEILGLYGPFAPGAGLDVNGPIILFLEALQNYCEEEGLDFAAEVRLTYLHELGHHFGWDEEELDQRGLS